jgi:hypothetical protein
MIPLIDCDILRYEIGYCAEYVDEKGNPQLRDFNFVKELYDQRVEEIIKGSRATDPPMFFLTACEKTVEMLNRRGKLTDAKPVKFQPNFREALAVTKPYKGNRKQDKPYHYYNLTAYILSQPGVRIAIGVEADDLMSMYQMDPKHETIICSRDKDLKITPGWHYSWECGKQKEWGPFEVLDIGYLEPYGDNQEKVRGVGKSFFYYQLLVGDATDNIPGCPGIGKVKAYNALVDLTSEAEMYNVCEEFYRTKLPDEWEARIVEQANLLWMRRSMNDVWEVPDS